MLLEHPEFNEVEGLTFAMMWEWLQAVADTPLVSEQ
jgi:hypothetical protein